VSSSAAAAAAAEAAEAAVVEAIGIQAPRVSVFKQALARPKPPIPRDRGSELTERGEWTDGGDDDARLGRHALQRLLIIAVGNDHGGLLDQLRVEFQLRLDRGKFRRRSSAQRPAEATRSG